VTGFRQRLKIAFVVHECDRRGGHNRYVAELADRLSTRHEVHLFARRWRDIAVDRVTAHRVPAIDWTDSLRILSFLAVISRYCRIQDFDIVHSQGVCTPWFDVMTAHVCHQARLQASYRFQSGRPVRSAHYWLSLRLAAMFQAHWECGRRQSWPTRVIACSAKTRQEMVSLCGADPSVMRLVYPGVDAERFHPRNRAAFRREVLREAGWPEDARVLLFVGAIGKGLGTAIEALAEMWGDPSPVLLVIGKLPERDYAKQIRSGNLEGRVRFANPAGDIHRYFAAADALVFPSLYDSFGFVVLEAMASGVPVVVSRQAGASELVVPGQNGFVLDDPGDPHALAKLAGQALDDGAFWRRLAAGARDTAEMYTWDRAATETLRVYRELVDESGGRRGRA
jgi:UDP-glucose:(heptosyl)LPS alpha-1,3-glucosyltransferase